MANNDIDTGSVYRILDANLNRLREGLRVVEEFARFIHNNEPLAVTLRECRHAVREIVAGLDGALLIAGRDVENDCFSRTLRAEEMSRATLESVAIANIKRAQEASRVIEEFSKPLIATDAAAAAKRIRFKLYEIETELLITTKKKKQGDTA